MTEMLPETTREKAPLVVVLARAALALDELVQAGNRAQVRWHETIREMADMTVDIIAVDPAYRVPPTVIESLGADFAAGALISAAKVKGWVTYDDQFRTSELSPVDNLLARIELAVSNADA